MSLTKRYCEIITLLYCRKFIRAMIPLFPDCRRKTIFRSEGSSVKNFPFKICRSEIIDVICRMISVRYHSGYTRHVIIMHSETAGSRSWSRTNLFEIKIFLNTEIFCYVCNAKHTKIYYNTL